MASSARSSSPFIPAHVFRSEHTPLSGGIDLTYNPMQSLYPNYTAGQSFTPSHGGTIQYASRSSSPLVSGPVLFRPSTPPATFRPSAQSNDTRDSLNSHLGVVQMHPNHGVVVPVINASQAKSRPQMSTHAIRESTTSITEKTLTESLPTSSRKGDEEKRTQPEKKEKKSETLSDLYSVADNQFVKFGPLMFSTARPLSAPSAPSSSRSQVQPTSEHSQKIKHTPNPIVRPVESDIKSAVEKSPTSTESRYSVATSAATSHREHGNRSYRQNQSEQSKDSQRQLSYRSANSHITASLIRAQTPPASQRQLYVAQEHQSLAHTALPLQSNFTPESPKLTAQLIKHDPASNPTTTVTKPGIVKDSTSQSVFAAAKDQVKPVIIDSKPLQSLVMSNNQLMELPREIGLLETLSNLDISSNALSALPHEIIYLSNLQELNISGNRISQLPIKFEDIQGLVVFKAGQNKLKDVPLSLTRISGIVNLDLSSNVISALPSSISSLTNLEAVNLSGNRLSSIPEEISTLKKMKTLDISVNSISLLPSSISECTSLKRLNAVMNVCSQLPDGIGKLNSLEELRLDNNLITSLPKEVATLARLSRLTVLGNPLQSPPPVIYRKGTSAIINYLRSLQ